MKKGKKNEVLKGVISEFFETGTEGVLWSFCEDGKKGYNGLHILEAGDYLTIYDKRKKIIFEGKIKPDFEIGNKRIPHSNNWQPVALGCWIRWTQKGFKPDDWAKLFFKKPPLRATLRKK